MGRLDKLVQVALAVTLVVVVLALAPWRTATVAAARTGTPAVGESVVRTPTAPPARGTDGHTGTGTAQKDTGVTEVGLLQLTALLVFFLAADQSRRRREARGSGRAPERHRVEL